jgi:hypothetical protein
MSSMRSRIHRHAEQIQVCLIFPGIVTSNQSFGICSVDEKDRAKASNGRGAFRGQEK